MALGTIADWKDLYAHYNDVNKYTTQLRALEKAETANPSPQRNISCWDTTT